ncbi:MAG TPA: PadR family transcriptional regulator [Solirubrobacteraceae bacterium]|nr:PadR family transcriptional regulator [Solirubrobacteraceae bacterium]
MEEGRNVVTGKGMGKGQAPAGPPMRSVVNWALLGLIIERPSYAYELARRFERTYDGVIALSSVSHAYTALGCLRERGFIEDVPLEGRGARSKHRYRASDRGFEEHARWLIGSVGEDRCHQRVLIVQLGALARYPERAIAVLDSYEQACLAEMAAAPAAGKEEQGPGVIRLVARLAREETQLRVSAKLAWVQFVRQEFMRLAEEEPVRVPARRQALPGRATRARRAA